MKLEYILPADIEKTSFRIIEQELHEMGREIPEDKKHVILSTECEESWGK